MGRRKTKRNVEARKKTKSNKVTATPLCSPNGDKDLLSCLESPNTPSGSKLVQTIKRGVDVVMGHFMHKKDSAEMFFENDCESLASSYRTANALSSTYTEFSDSFGSGQICSEGRSKHARRRHRKKLRRLLDCNQTNKDWYACRVAPFRGVDLFSCTFLDNKNEKVSNSHDSIRLSPQSQLPNLSEVIQELGNETFSDIHRADCMKLLNNVIESQVGYFKRVALRRDISDYGLLPILYKLDVSDPSLWPLLRKQVDRFMETTVNDNLEGSTQRSRNVVDYLWVLICEHKNDYDDILQFFQQLIQIDGKDKQFWKNAGTILSSMHDNSLENDLLNDIPNVRVRQNSISPMAIKLTQMDISTGGLLSSNSPTPSDPDHKEQGKDAGSVSCSKEQQLMNVESNTLRQVVNAPMPKLKLRPRSVSRRRATKKALIPPNERERSNIEDENKENDSKREKEINFNEKSPVIILNSHHSESRRTKSRNPNIIDVPDEPQQNVHASERPHIRGIPDQPTIAFLARSVCCHNKNSEGQSARKPSKVSTNARSSLKTTMSPSSCIESPTSHNNSRQSTDLLKKPSDCVAASRAHNEAFLGEDFRFIDEDLSKSFISSLTLGDEFSNTSEIPRIPSPPSVDLLRSSDIPSSSNIPPTPSSSSLNIVKSFSCSTSLCSEPSSNPKNSELCSPNGSIIPSPPHPPPLHVSSSVPPAPPPPPPNFMRSPYSTVSTTNVLRSCPPAPPPPPPNLLKSCPPAPPPPPPNLLKSCPPAPSPPPPNLLKSGPPAPPPPPPNLSKSGPPAPPPPPPNLLKSGPPHPPGPPPPFLLGGSKHASSPTSSLTSHDVSFQESYPKTRKTAVLRWDSINQQLAQTGTMWKDYVEPDSVKEEREEIEKALEQVASVPRVYKTPKVEKKEQPLGPQLSQGRAMALEILLAKARPLTVLEIIDNIESNETNKLSNDFLTGLLGAYPADDEISLFKNVEKSVVSRKCEELCWEVGRRPTLKSRVELAIAKGNIMGEISNHKQCASSLLKACEGLRSPIISKILYKCLQYGNFINQGSNMSHAVGFKVKSLPNILSLKGKGSYSSWSFVDCLVKYMNVSVEELENIKEVLQLFRSYKINELSTVVEEQGRTIERLKKLMLACKDEHLEKHYQSFFDLVDSDITELIESVKKLLSLEEELRVYFCANKTETIEELGLVIFNAFTSIIASKKKMLASKQQSVTGKDMKTPTLLRATSRRKVESENSKRLSSSEICDLFMKAQE